MHTLTFIHLHIQSGGEVENEVEEIKEAENIVGLKEELDGNAYMYTYTYKYV
jgi:hypothetical protein